MIAYRATACPEAVKMPTPCRNRPSRCSPSSSRRTRFPRSVRSVLNSTSASRAHNGGRGDRVLPTRLRSRSGAVLPGPHCLGPHKLSWCNGRRGGFRIRRQQVRLLPGHENGSTNRTKCSCRASHRCGSRSARPARAGCDSPGATSTVSSTGAHAMDGRYGTIALAEGEEFTVWEKGSHACCRRVVRSLASTPPGEIVQSVCPMTSERSIGDPS